MLQIQKLLQIKKNCCCKLSDRKVCTCTDGVEDLVQLYPGPTNQSGKAPCFAVLLGQNARLMHIFCTHCGHQINDAIEQTATDSVDRRTNQRVFPPRISL